VRKLLPPGIVAGCVYAVIVFLVGFALGTVRVLWVVPRLGETAAVLLEAPFMLAFSWIASRWSTRWFRVPVDTGPRLVMGASAFVILMLLELGVSMLIFGRSMAEHLATYRTASGMIGLLAQLAFASFPCVQVWGARRSSPA